jgi:DegV family protein with EDD domain
MSKVALVTDSTSDIPSDFLRSSNITIAPLQIIWDGKTMQDGVDIQPHEFYQRLSNSKSLPTTSQTSPAVFTAIYERLLEQGFDILSIHLSSKLSGTLDSAQQAKNGLPGAKIELIDSEMASIALGFQVMTIAKAAAQGATLAECKQLADQAVKCSGAIFALNTLEFLRRGGRIGGAAAFLGTALNLKPILELKDGQVAAIDRVRTLSKAIDRLLDLFEDRLQKRTPLHISALHSASPDAAQILLERTCQRFNINNITDAFITEITPALGSHTGPGALGLAFLAGM